MDLLLLTAEPHPDVVLPSLSLLAHTVRTAPPDVSSLLEAGSADILIVDARLDLPAARGLCRLLGSTGRSIPAVVVVNEGGLVAVNADWGLDEILLPNTGPAEIDARLRLLIGRRGSLQDQEGVGKISLGELVIDESTYTARLRGRPLDLTYKEFELLKYLAQHAGRVFTRAQLLHEVWGYDFFGGTRTVDVHVRRLRAKLGPEYESLIGTVRNVGYKAVRPTRRLPGGEREVRRTFLSPMQITTGKRWSIRCAASDGAPVAGRRWPQRSSGRYVNSSLRQLSPTRWHPSVSRCCASWQSAAPNICWPPVHTRAGPGRRLPESRCRTGRCIRHGRVGGASASSPTRYRRRDDPCRNVENWWAEPLLGTRNT